MRLGAEGHLHAVRRRDLREVDEQRALVCVGRIRPVEAMRLSRGGEVALGLAVDRRPGDDDLVDRTVEITGQGGEARAVPVGRGERGGEDRIVAPDGGARTVSLRDMAELGDGAGGLDDRSLQRAGVAGDGHLDDEGHAWAATAASGASKRARLRLQKM